MPHVSCCTPAILEQAAECDLPLSSIRHHFRSVIRLSANEFAVIDSTCEPGAAYYHFHPATVDVALEADEAVARYGDLALRLCCLTGETPEIMGIVNGEPGSDRMDSTHLRFAADDGRKPSIFLIRFGAPPPPRRRPDWEFLDGKIIFRPAPDEPVIVLNHSLNFDNL